MMLEERFGLTLTDIVCDGVARQYFSLEQFNKDLWDELEALNTLSF